MPPLRSVPAVKPTKTERTHEENQERAYIAASRRSDRSIEARMESAKRASEIHKKRTGRALRITQEDVENEEMYEEEDGDFRMNMRNLAAAQQYANSPAFHNLQAFLATQAALASNQQANFMMTAQQPVGDQMPQQPVQNPYLAHLINQRLMQMSQMQMLSPQQQSQQRQFQQAQQLQRPQQIQIPSSPSPNSPAIKTPTSYRTSPYPTPNALTPTRPVQHHRSASIAVPADSDASAKDVTDQERPSASRRNSMPAASVKLSSPTTSHPAGAQNTLSTTDEVVEDDDQQTDPVGTEEESSTLPAHALGSAHYPPQSPGLDLMSSWLNQPTLSNVNSNVGTNSFAFNPMLIGTPWMNPPMNQGTWPGALQTNFGTTESTGEDLSSVSGNTSSWSAPQSALSMTNDFNDSLTLSPAMPLGKAGNSTFPDEWSSFINEDDAGETKW